MTTQHTMRANTAATCFGAPAGTQWGKDGIRKSEQIPAAGKDSFPGPIARQGSKKCNTRL